MGERPRSLKMKPDSAVTRLLEESERELATKQKPRAAAQKFSGSLRISPENVFVGSKVGKQAIQDLRRAFENRRQPKPAKAC